MDIALFFIFLICDLIIVPICWFSYGKQGEYREGMVMGVHIPSHAVEDPEVRKICGKIQKHWNRFHQINLLLSVLICFLCFYNFTLFIIVWSVWLAEYVAVLYALIIVPHRQMYRLKLQRGGRGKYADGADRYFCVGAFRENGAYLEMAPGAGTSDSGHSAASVSYGAKIPAELRGNDGGMGAVCVRRVCLSSFSGSAYRNCAAGKPGVQ